MVDRATHAPCAEQIERRRNELAVLVPKKRQVQKRDVNREERNREQQEKNENIIWTVRAGRRPRRVGANANGGNFGIGGRGGTGIPAY